jgi:pilus assembly protein CpaF
VSTVAQRVHRLLAESPSPRTASAGTIATLVRREDPIAPAAELEGAVAEVQARLEGLGPLAPLLADPLVTDVLVNGPGPVWVERAGILARTAVVLDRAEVSLLVERVVAPVGRRADPMHPVVDARLADGSRVHVVVPPLAVDGPYLSIRRFGVRAVELSAIAEPEAAEALVAAVRDRANIVVSGGTGSGKTTLLNALCGSIPDGQRVVTVEDAAELRLPAAHVVRLEARPGSSDGVPEVTIRELLRAALRMRPDRVVVGEVRGPEAADLLDAMSTGHDGSLATVHANSAGDALGRLESLVLAAGRGLSPVAVRERLARSIDLLVHVERASDGRRRVTEVVTPLPPRRGPAVRPVVVIGSDDGGRRSVSEVADLRSGRPDGR